MKKLLSVYCLIILLSASNYSCKKDFLSNPLGGLLPDEQYVVDLRTGKEYLNGIYLQLSSGVYEGLNVIYADAIADDVKPVTGALYLTAQYAWKQQADEVAATVPGTILSNMNLISTLGYRVIFSCNFLIKRAGSFKKENVDQVNNLVGQTYVLRALTYWNLVNVFAQSYNFTAGGQHPGVPYLDTDDFKAINGKRLTVAEIYEHIIKDLRQGIDLLPASSAPNVINRYTAMALLSRVYLTMENYGAAKNYATAVISKVPLMTQNYPDSLFTSHDTEALLQLINLDRSIILMNTPSLYYRQAGNFAATQDIVDLLTEGAQDSRRKWVSKTGTTTIIWNIVKFPSGLIGGFTRPTNGYYPDVIRSSELYLIAAESYAKSNMMEDSARFYLNAIRRRANPSIVPVTASGTALLDSIYKERRKELAFEGFRMYDLLRWKKGVSRTDAVNAESKTLPYPSNRAIAPMPLRDVQQLGTEQNPGY